MVQTLPPSGNFTEEEARSHLCAVDALLCEQPEVCKLSSAKIYPFSEVRSSYCDTGLLPVDSSGDNLRSKDFFAFASLSNIDELLHTLSLLGAAPFSVVGIITTPAAIFDEVEKRVKDTVDGSNLMARVIPISNFEEMVLSMDDCSWCLVVGHDKVAKIRAADALARKMVLMCSPELLDLPFLNHDVACRIPESQKEAGELVTQVRFLAEQPPRKLKRHCIDNNIGYYNLNVALGQRLTDDFKGLGWSFNSSSFSEVSGILPFKDAVSVPMYLLGMVRFR
jgi:hypothetical protein